MWFWDGVFSSIGPGRDPAVNQQEGLRGGTLPADFFFEEYGVMFRLATLFARTGARRVCVAKGGCLWGGFSVTRVLGTKLESMVRH